MRQLLVICFLFLSINSLLKARTQFDDLCENGQFDFTIRECVEEIDPDMAILGEVVETEVLSLRNTDIRFPNVPLRRGYQNRMYGPVKVTNQFFGGRSYWRYVTFYNSERGERRLRDFPSIFEECHDFRGFSQYSQSVTISAQIEASFSAFDIGFKTTIGVDRTVGVNRNLNGVYGEEAVHTPFLIAEVWRGRIYIQSYNPQTRESTLRNVDPYTFYATDVNPVLRVRREEVRSCD